MSDRSSVGAGPSSGMGLPGAPINLRGRSRPVESIIKIVLLASALLSVAITTGIIIALIGPVLDFFTQVPVGDFFATEG